LKFHRLYSHRIFILFAFLLLNSVGAYSQNLIDYNEKYIIKYMKENQPEFNINNVINNKFSYLKYSDNSDNQTLLFFLDENSVCKNIRIICNFSLKNEKINELNSSYKSIGTNKWSDKREGKKYLIEMKDEDWSVIITIEPEK
jgi:hypothetical protein